MPNEPWLDAFLAWGAAQTAIEEEKLLVRGVFLGFRWYCQCVQLAVVLTIVSFVFQLFFESELVLLGRKEQTKNPHFEYPPPGSKPGLIRVR